jgi:hypothetical protein
MKMSLGIGHSGHTDCGLYDGCSGWIVWGFWLFEDACRQGAAPQHIILDDLNDEFIGLGASTCEIYAPAELVESGPTSKAPKNAGGTETIADWCLAVVTRQQLSRTFVVPPCEAVN